MYIPVPVRFTLIVYNTLAIKGPREERCVFSKTLGVYWENGACPRGRDAARV